MMMGQFGGSKSASSSSSRCQDCGNQSKRDCAYNRCRTCCKTKGFHCQTHIKSTWLPSVSRRQQQINQSHILHQHNPKRPRPIPSSGLEGEGNFPAEVSFPATFGCVRVSSMEESVDHYAYQTSVNIGGHVFRGILYDQGPTNSLGAPHQSNLINNPNVASHHHHHHHHALTAAAGTLTVSASSAHDDVHDHHSHLASSSSSYPFPFNNAFLPGTHFFPHSSKS